MYSLIISFIMFQWLIGAVFRAVVRTTIPISNATQSYQCSSSQKMRKDATNGFERLIGKIIHRHFIRASVFCTLKKMI